MMQILLKGATLADPMERYSGPMDLLIQDEMCIRDRHHPLLGDPLYGPKKPRLGLGRQMLHAHEIHFIHPVTGAAMDFSAPPPADFINTLEKLRQAQKDGRRLW